MPSCIWSRIWNKKKNNFFLLYLFWGNFSAADQSLSDLLSGNGSQRERRKRGFCGLQLRLVQSFKSSLSSHAVFIWVYLLALAQQHTVRMRWWTLEKSSRLCTSPGGRVPMLPGVTQHPIKDDLSLRAGCFQTPCALSVVFSPVITFCSTTIFLLRKTTKQDAYMLVSPWHLLRTCERPILED